MKWVKLLVLLICSPASLGSCFEKFRVETNILFETSRTIYPASEFHMPTFRNTQFHLHGGVSSLHHLWRWNR